MIIQLKKKPFILKVSAQDAFKINNKEGDSIMEDKNKNNLTTAAGTPVVDNQNSMTAGPRGPVLLQDVWLLEKSSHFNREVIPEIRMHANG